MAKSVRTKSGHWTAAPGIILNSHFAYFRLIEAAFETNLRWLRWQLFSCGVAQLKRSSEAELQRLLPILLASAASRRRVDGTESALLTCLQVAQRNGNRHLISATLAALRKCEPRHYTNADPPIAFYDSRSRLLTLFDPTLWPTLARDLVHNEDSAVRTVLRMSASRSAAAGALKPGLGVWSMLQGIDGVLVALGAASDCLIPGGTPQPNIGQPGTASGLKEPGGPQTGTTQSDQVIKGDNSSDAFRLACYLSGGRIVPRDDEDEPHGPPDPPDDRSLDEILGPAEPPLTQDEIDDLTAATPPPDDGQTLDEILGPPDPPLTQDEIDQLTRTPNPNDDGTAGPTRGPTGPAYTPIPDDGTGGGDGKPHPSNPALMPREDDSGPGGPVGPAFLKASYTGQRYFQAAGSYFLPATGFLSQSGYTFGAEFVGANVGGQCAFATFNVTLTPIRNSSVG